MTEERISGRGEVLDAIRCGPGAVLLPVDDDWMAQETERAIEAGARPVG
jgi:hypothetical protein